MDDEQKASVKKIVTILVLGMVVGAATVGVGFFDFGSPASFACVALVGLVLYLSRRWRLGADE